MKRIKKLTMVAMLVVCMGMLFSGIVAQAWYVWYQEEETVSISNSSSSANSPYTDHVCVDLPGANILVQGKCTQGSIVIKIVRPQLLGTKTVAQTSSISANPNYYYEGSYDPASGDCGYKYRANISPSGKSTGTANIRVPWY